MESPAQACWAPLASYPSQSGTKGWILVGVIHRRLAQLRTGTIEAIRLNVRRQYCGIPLQHSNFVAEACFNASQNSTLCGNQQLELEVLETMLSNDH